MNATELAAMLVMEERLRKLGLRLEQKVYFTLKSGLTSRVK